MTDASTRNCWCHFHILENRAQRETTRESRRELLRDQVIALDPPRGLVALAGEEPVGWCGVEPRPVSGMFSPAVSSPDTAATTAKTPTCGPSTASWCRSRFAVRGSQRPFSTVPSTTLVVNGRVPSRAIRSTPRSVMGGSLLVSPLAPSRCSRGRDFKRWLRSLRAEHSSTATSSEQMIALRPWDGSWQVLTASVDDEVVRFRDRSTEGRDLSTCQILKSLRS